MVWLFRSCHNVFLRHINCYGAWEVPFPAIYSNEISNVLSLLAHPTIFIVGNVFLSFNQLVIILNVDKILFIAHLT